MVICDPNVCSGCGLCVSVCPKQCIELRLDTEGFLHPNIHSDKCISCLACKKMCPQNNIFQNSNDSTPKAYCAQIENKDILNRSSSGGLFYAFAQYYIEKLGGVVFASKMNENMSFEFVKIENIFQLSEAQGSVYFQSNPRLIYKEIKTCIEKMPVLFIGCPCQVLALKQYIGRNTNLFTIDLVCHGVGSKKLFQQHITELEKKEGSRVIKFRFRCKDRKSYINHFLEKITFENGVIKYLDGLKSSYMAAYFHESIYRESCYQCKYASIPRVGDVTIGDYAGVDRSVVPMYRIKEGVSVLLINNEHGKQCFHRIKDDLWVIERPLEEAIRTNANISQHSTRPSERDSLSLLSSSDFLAMASYSIKNIMGIRLSALKKDIIDRIKIRR